MKRTGPGILVRGEGGRMVDYPEQAMTSETAISLLGDAGHYPEIGNFRRAVDQWRFFHGFRTDRESPLRMPCLAITAPLLDETGFNMIEIRNDLIRDKIGQRVMKKPMLITDRGLAPMAITQQALDILEAGGLGRAIFADVDPNPTDRNLEAGVKAFRDGGHVPGSAWGRARRSACSRRKASPRTVRRRGGRGQPP